MLVRSLGVVAVVVGLLWGPLEANAGNWYINATAGATWLEDSDSTLDTIPIDTEISTDFDTGFEVSGAVGHAWNFEYPLCSLFRLEGEISYRENDIDTVDVENVGELSGDGDMSALGFLGNAWCEIPFLSLGGTIYGGGGVGYTNVSFNDAATSRGKFADDDDWVVGYQLGIGIRKPINPDLNLSLGYRYFGTGDPDFKHEIGAPFDAEYDSHNIDVGIQFDLP